MDFKDQLVMVRAKLNISQEELAKRLSVSFSTVNRWECGRTKPTRKAVCVFADFCRSNGIDLEELK